MTLCWNQSPNSIKEWGRREREEGWEEEEPMTKRPDVDDLKRDSLEQPAKARKKKDGEGKEDEGKERDGKK